MDDIKKSLVHATEFNKKINDEMIKVCKNYNIPLSGYHITIILHNISK